MSSITAAVGSRRVTADPAEGLSLLQILQRASIPLSAPCGGNGTCGKCMVTVTDNTGTRTLRACGFRPDRDCTVTLPGAAGSISSEHAAHAPIPENVPLGAAVDLGTTTVAVRLCRMDDGSLLGQRVEWNAQRTYGADVISRSQYCMEHPDGLLLQKNAIRGQITDMILRLCLECGADPGRVISICAAGNTIMQHILCGLSPAGIAVYPYVPLSLFREDAKAPWEDERLPNAALACMPCVSGYIGGDITAGLQSSGLSGSRETALFLDIGTNGEMALLHEGELLCCSVASGPAFEGACISCGSPSTPGAVCGVSMEGSRLRLMTIDDMPPAGICGSGLIDLLALLLELGIVDETGRLLPPEEAETDLGGMLEEDDRGCGILHLTPDRRLYLTAGDVRQLQLAKAAVAAGISVLLEERCLRESQVDRLILAGGFGSHLNLKSAAAIGLIPGSLAGRTEALGNTALAGAELALLHPEIQGEMNALAARCRYIELSGHAGFRDRYIDCMMFE